MDVSVPDLLALSHPALHEPEALRPQAYAPVEQEHPLALRRGDARATRFEASAVLLRDDRERQAIADGGPGRLRASVRRAVVHEHEIRREAASLDGVRERLDRRGQVRRLVVHGHDDRQALGHRSRLNSRRLA